MKYVGQSRRHSLFSLMYLHVSLSLGGKATSQYLRSASRESDWRNLAVPPPQGSSEGSGWAGMFVFKPETPWPFVYGHWGVNLNLVLE